jgi:high-affinity Fe2+/Pb2+ permease
MEPLAANSISDQPTEPLPAPEGPVEDRSEPASDKVSSSLLRASRSGPVGLSLGAHIGTLLGLTLFAGMYSLLFTALRISVTIFLAGLTLGVAGGIMTALTHDAYRAFQQADRGGNLDSSLSGFLISMWEGLAVGLGILLGVLPISLACSLVRESPMLPWLVYALGCAMLALVGAVRAPSWRALPSSVAYALLPGLFALLLAHGIGDRLREITVP